ncbi:MAG: helix-turn-helix domain-containing protein [Acidimicrobiia bacterium]|nr:helix-turn-helix domain-containing protein [Acidimicrobiia bacterium]
MRNQSRGLMVGERRIRRDVYIANSLYTKFMRASQVLRNARTKSGMSQLEVARRSGIAQSVISDYERGKREPGADTYLQLLEILGFTIELRVRRRTKTPTLPDSKLARLILRHRKEIIALARQHGARNVRVFGSVATGKTKKRSDIDFLVDLDPGVGLLEMIGLELKLKDLLGVKVDLGSARLLKPNLRDEVFAHAVAL